MCIRILPAGDEKPKIIDALLDAGAIPDLQDENGWTALMVAARKDITTAIQTLLSAGARVDIQVSSFSA